jgi:hypothetical protein
MKPGQPIAQLVIFRAAHAPQQSAGEARCDDRSRDGVYFGHNSKV